MAISNQTGGKSFDRLNAFSDGVFAIAITLLALDLRLPELHHPTSSQIAQSIRDQLPNILSFVLSFLLIGRYWIVHHNFFQTLRRYDNGLLWLNLLFLMSVVFMPFPTSVLADYGDQNAGVVFYAASLTVVGLLQAALYYYASKDHRLIDSAVEKRKVQYGTRVSLMIPIVFLTSIPVAFYSPTLATVMWLLTLVLRRPLKYGL